MILSARTKRAGRRANHCSPNAVYADLLMQGAEGWVTLHDPHGTVVVACGPGMNGMPPTALKGGRLDSLIEPRELDRFRNAWRRAVGGEASYVSDCQLLFPDGARRLVDISLRRTDAERVIAVTRDPRTSPVDRSRLARLAGERIKVYEHMGEAFFSLDHAWNITYMNPAAQAMTRDVDRVGSDLWEAFPSLVGTRFDDEYHRAMRDHVVVSFEEYFPPMGRWFAATACPTDEGLSILFRDVTKQKQVETTLIENQQRTKQALDAQVAAVQQLRAVNEMKEAFLSSISHDLRTPLTAVLGYAETLAEHDTVLGAPMRGEMLARLAVNARRLHERLRDLLDTHRLMRREIQPKLERVDVADVVATLVATSGIAAVREVTVACESVIVEADPGILVRMVTSMLDNVGRHTPADCPAWISVRPSAEGAEIVIADAGPGVAENRRHAIFQPFIGQAHHSPGAGVGLALVTGFASLHGGRAWVTERDGGGAAFHVWLPARRAAPRAGLLARQAASEIFDTRRTL